MLQLGQQYKALKQNILKDHLWFICSNLSINMLDDLVLRDFLLKSFSYAWQLRRNCTHSSF